MAQIDIEKKESGGLGWLWGLLALLLLAALLWWLFAINGDDVEAEYATTGDDTSVVADQPDQVTIAVLIADPEAWIDRTFTGVFEVVEVPTDRGFVITDGTARIPAVLNPNPISNESDIDVNPGISIRINEAFVYATDDLSRVAGPLDADTRNLLRDEPVFLAIDPKDIDMRVGED